MTEDGYKICPQCGIRKPINDFYRKSRVCKSCANKNSKKYYEEHMDKIKEYKKLLDENERLKKLIMDYMGEFRLCRFCAHVHEDCSPTDGSCSPKWRGL